MNEQSPPKRVTRARAAAKDTGVKTARSATASSKAKATRAAATTKRKTRSDDAAEDELALEPEQIIEPEPHHTRGRPKKAAHAEPAVEEPAQEPEPHHTRGRPKKVTHKGPGVEGPAKEPEAIEPEPHHTRGRSKKTAHPEPTLESAIKEEMPAPAKLHRGRAKKIVTEQEPAPPTRSLRGRTVKIELPHEDNVAGEGPEAPKKTQRGRATTMTKTSVSKTSTVRKPAVPKKTVKFEEPEKENIAPPAANVKAKAKAVEAVTGLRAKPIRKPAAATRATRATRGQEKTVADEQQKSSPLSPKKVTQIATAKESASDDELALNEKTPMKPLTRSPIKPPGSIFNSTRKIDCPTSLTVNRATISLQQNLGESVMASPARRPPQSPFKDAMKADPQKIPLGGSMLGSPFKFSLPAAKSTSADSPFKTSLLQSPARRPASPTKVAENGSPTRSGFSNADVEATPKVSTFKISRFNTPRIMPKNADRTGQMLPPSAPVNLSTGSPNGHNNADELDELGSDLPTRHNLSFSGRLSSIVPRGADPIMSMEDPIVEDGETVIPISEPIIKADPLVKPVPEEDLAADELDIVEVEASSRSLVATSINSLPCDSTKEFQELRDNNEDPFQDSDSEDELASNSPKYSPIPIRGFESATSSQNFLNAATPTPFASFFKTPRSVASQTRATCRDKIGFTPLARQLNDWCAASPSTNKPEAEEFDADPASPTPIASKQQAHVDNGVATDPSPMKNTFFDDEMSVRDEIAAVEDVEGADMSDTDILAENFEPVMLDEEDFALANEANELSLLEPDEIEAIIDENEDMFVSHEQEQALSEASQEYGDENAVPIDSQLIDPQLLASSESPALATPKFATPKRVLAERTFHTVSKVPLKPAADDTPMRPSPKKRSASISRLPASRPTSNLARHNTVISYSPSKNSTPRSTPKRRVQEEPEHVPATPKGDVEISSIIATPARTPRRDLNTALLKGAVVFVDVYTSEGADASALFTELLAQMGARCVKNWSWNGNLEDGGKIGITHVVFKDGGKRTLEKVRETGGVVSCVGVGWVLE